jgi:hypothetical protein
VTIGIAVSGPMAGLAAWRALRAVEAVGRGAIGGFASFAAVTADGRVLRAETQRGGGAALWGGEPPPPEIAEAPMAGLMSSGPDRPEPLSQFCDADPAAGLVTGHRLPNMAGPDGVPPLRAALALLAEGATPETAVVQALAPDPDGDAGLIAMDRSGRVALDETPAVRARNDRGAALLGRPEIGLRAAVLHNAIFPHGALAALALSAAEDAVAPLDAAEAWAALTGLRIDPGSRALEIDAAGRPVRLTAQPDAWRSSAWEGSPVRRGDPVLRDGLTVGRVVSECFAIARRGAVVGARGEDVVRWRWTKQDG